jgi:uncharacterized protein (DUF697 family)
MTRLPDLASGFKALREIDLNSIRNQAEAPFHLAIIGNIGVGKSTLITQLLCGPGVRESLNPVPISEQRLDQELFIQPHSVVILMLDATQPEHLLERQVFERLRSDKVPIIIGYNKSAPLENNPPAIFAEALRWPGSEFIAITASDRQTLLLRLAPALLRIYKRREVLLARHVPMVREPVSRKLIEDTSFINASYSFASGLAEINIFFDLPLNIADMVMLTKNQALMAYKIALSFDLPSDWHETIPKLTAVVGTAFLWRLIARQLVGLIPVFGIIPNVAVSYAGTYTVGQAIYRWCANNEKVNPQTLRSAFNEALKRGREIARTLVTRNESGLIDNSKKASSE